MKNKCDRFTVTPTAWTLIEDGPLTGEENMRRDREALEFQRDPSVLPLVRFYRWAEPTLSYGRLQARDGAEALSSALGGRAVVQRPTGGGMVLHDLDISFSIVWRRDHPTLPPCIKSVYRLFHEALAIAFRAQGMQVLLHQAEGPKRTLPGACYQEFSQDDILYQGKKWVGGALRVTSWGRLYQGNFKPLASIPREDWERILIAAFETNVFFSPPNRF